MRLLRCLLALALWHGIAHHILAVSVVDYSVCVSATVQTNPAIITLSWQADPVATGYSLFRKNRDDIAWGSATALPAIATNYNDTNVVAGHAYEYQIIKSAPSYSGVGYVYAGIEAPLTESRGKVILLVDKNCSTNLVIELSRLQQDLIGDGWGVIRHDVGRMSVDPANTNAIVWSARSNELASIKALIVSDYIADPTNVKAVFLLGHLPVPYSGNTAPDGHVTHQGAWPADAYYGDMDGIWNDATVKGTASTDLRNWNFRSDGKFDHTALPSSVELQVGRVDLANLPSFAKTETELLRQYLNKDHNFRHKLVTAERRGLIDDNFGVNGGEAFAVNGWRNFSAFFGVTNVVEADWFSTLATQSYLWGYGCGPGNFTGAAGVGNTSDFAAGDPKVVFTMLFGSLFGDWDSSDNFLRAPLATPTYTLTCAWAGRPNWQCHHMGLGETIGFSTRWAQNNGSTYWANYGAGFEHIALMGDPTLRMHPVAPPTSLVIDSNVLGGVNLSWNPSPDNVLGYHVYRAPTAAGPFTRLNANLINGTNYSDAIVSHDVYMVRSVKLEVSGSGSYYNASQGIFQNLAGNVGVVAVAPVQPTNNTTVGLGAHIPITASVFDPSNSITRVEFQANGVKIGEINGFPYSWIWSNALPGDYALTISAFSDAVLVANSDPVTVHVGNLSPILSILSLDGGSYVIRGTGFPNYVYQIQSVVDPQNTNWQTLGAATADSAGGFRFTNSDGVAQRFFRALTLFPQAL